MNHFYTTFRGFPCCSCLATWIPSYEAALRSKGIISGNVEIFQLRGGAAASAGTHSQGGAADLGVFSTEALRVSRQMGAAAWHRTPQQGFSGHHQHLVLKGCPTNDPAFYQIEALNAGFNGLGAGGHGGRDDGPRDNVRFPIVDWQTAINTHVPTPSKQASTSSGTDVIPFGLIRKVNPANIRPGLTNNDVKLFQQQLRAASNGAVAHLNPSGTTGFYGDETKSMCKALYQLWDSRYPNRGYGSGDLTVPGIQMLHNLGLL